MQSLTATTLMTLLLALQQSQSARAQSGSEPMDMTYRAGIGSIEFKGAKLRVYEIDGLQFAEPSIQFDQSCGASAYNYVYLKYQISMPVIVTMDALKKPIDVDWKKVAPLRLARLEIHPDEAITGEESQVRVQLLQLRKSGEAQLAFLCEDFNRCQALRTELLANPDRIQAALQFSTVGIVGNTAGTFVKFDNLASSNPPPTIDCLKDRWVVFQRRVDGSLSFAQNWDTYVKGFGNHHTNYWMGLNQLFASTVSSDNNGYGLTARCELRVEMTDFSGNNYWGQYKFFQVLNPEESYRLRISDEVTGTSIQRVPEHNDRDFSTYDKNNRNCPSNTCSRHFGYGGWWYPGALLNLNGAYAPNGEYHNPTYMSAFVQNKHLSMAKSVMMFRCK